VIEVRAVITHEEVGKWHAQKICYNWCYPGCGSKVSHGERVAAMILNGLGFIDSRLYLFPEFLSDKPLDRLFNRPMLAEWFNDDASARCFFYIKAVDAQLRSKNDEPTIGLL
jgi:hypothetical protein